MFAPKTRLNSSNRRDKPYSRKAKPMSRSGSLLGTIKNIVSAPLSWFASNQEDFEDLGKRRRVSARDVSDVEDGPSERTGKRMRVDSPEPPPKRVHQSATGGYLDPPLFSSHAPQPNAYRKEVKPMLLRRSSIFGRSLPSNNRTMSVDPPSRYATLNRDPTMIPLPPGSPVRSSPARSVGLEDGPERPRTPFRLRTSLTPQPSPARPLRRESSAPPPLSNLQSRPIFVKPPPEEKKTSDLDAEKTISLGTLADISRGSRVPSRDRTLTSLGRISSISDQIASSISTDAILQPAKSLAEKTYEELELYKTPILPSRYRNATTIPSFLKPKRAHVPIPMKKSRESKPSLGMAEKFGKEKNGLSTRDDGKPYARKGGIRKMLARRKLEEEEEERERRNAESCLTSVAEIDEMETDIKPVAAKRDIGVSAGITSESEDERVRLRKAVAEKVIGVPDAPSPALNDPFLRPAATTPGGRQQPYGRFGHARIRDPGQRSVPLSRPPNKFSAAFSEEDSIDLTDQSMTVDDAAAAEKQQSEPEKTKAPPVFEAPEGFSFARDTSTISQDRARAKEPPISSLPFSLSVTTSTTGANAGDRAKETLPFKPPAAVFPIAQPSTEQGEKEKDKTPSAPAVSIVPPTPDQPPKETPAPPNLFSAPPITFGASSAATSAAASKPSGIPNFFANSPLLAGDKSATLVPPKVPSPKPFAPPSVTTPATPVKDPENPLWNGNDAAPSAPPKLFAQAAKPFTFGAGAKPAVAAATPSPLAAAAPLFGGQPKQVISPGTTEERQANGLPPAPTSGTAPTSVAPSSTPAEVPQAQYSPAKLSEPEKKANGSAPSSFFNFGAGTTSNVPKPLFGTGAPAASGSSFSMQPSQPSQATAGDAAQKPSFMFGQPQTASAGDKPLATHPSLPPQNAAATTEQKSPFTFGAPPMPTAASNTTAPVSTDTAGAPKPLFGGPSAGTGFTFGSPVAPAVPSPEAAKTTSPFAFGAPPATPPAGERQSSPFTFGAPGPSSGGSTGFSFGTPVKQDGAAVGSAPSTPTNTLPFMFGAQPARPVTPPSKPDEGMNMEESPVQMDTNGGQKKPSASITFGLGPTPTNPFGQNTSSGPGFTFGAPPATSNPFAPKDENKQGTNDASNGFNFNRTASAPAISTTFSFGAKSDQSTPPATAAAFGAPTNPFGQTQPSGTTSSPFTFGQQPSAPSANPFGVPSQPAHPSTGSAPSSPFQSAPTFTFGVPTGAPSNPFNFGSSAPSSPAPGATGLPQSSGSAPAFTFGQSSGSSGSALFNVGVPPPNTGQNTPGRAIKRLPRRGQVKR